MSSNLMSRFALYSFSNERIAAPTFWGATVSIPPTSFGRRLYSPTANHDFEASEVPDFNSRCNSLIMLSERGSQAWSMMKSMHRKWLVVVDAAFDSRFSVRVKHSGAGKSSFGHFFWMATVPLSEYSMSFRLNMLRAVYPERNNYVLSVLQFRGTRHILLLR